MVDVFSVIYHDFSGDLGVWLQYLGIANYVFQVLRFLYSVRIFRELTAAAEVMSRESGYFA